MKKKNKMSKQIKCYNINYLVEEEDIKDTPYEHRNDLSVNQKIKLLKRYEHRNDLSVNQKIKLLKSDLETDNLYKVGSTKEVIIDDEIKSEIDYEIANAISDETGWLVESFDWKVEEVKQTPTESDNTLEKFMKGDENDEMLVSEHKKLFGN